MPLPREHTALKGSPWQRILPIELLSLSPYYKTANQQEFWKKNTWMILLKDISMETDITN